MPRSSSLAITIVRTPTDPGEIRALIDAAIEHMTQIAGLPEPTRPSAPAAGAVTPDRGAAGGPGSTCPGDPISPYPG